MGSNDGAGLSRRHFFGRAAVVSAGVALAKPAVAEASAEDGTVEVSFYLNGRPERLTIDPRVTLLDALRERLHLTGTKKGCDRGQCGACTVHIGGRRVVSCLTLAATVRGKHVTTIEGLTDGASLHPVQRAFVDCDGIQCGFCTPGQVMSAVAVIQEGHAHTDAEIQEAMSGNICRCGAYPNIVAAVRQARGDA
jgi:xanthine dehydrogenase YagT iron-sulfur-binding subunit